MTTAGEKESIFLEVKYCDLNSVVSLLLFCASNMCVCVHKHIEQTRKRENECKYTMFVFETFADIPDDGASARLSSP